jgi:hypothetical protein
MEAMDFFQMSEGRWISQRTTHHLAMRRTELGQLEITASVLDATDPKVVEICQMHDVDPARAIGGAAVSWQGSMQWDEEGQTQEGATVLVLVPTPRPRNPDNCCAKRATLKPRRWWAIIRSMTRMA